MLCSDTGCHEAVKLQHLTLELAQELDEMLATSKTANGGYAQILLKVERGIVTMIDWTMRRFHKK